MIGPPVVRLEIESMKATILAAFSEQTMRMDEDVRRAVEAACTPENVRATIEEFAGKAIREAVSASLRSFFVYGEGRKEIDRIVAMKLGGKA